MELNLEIPATVPVMTLPDTVLFPQTILPLHIFEDRYQLMLQDALKGSRIFAVSRLDEDSAKDTGQFEPLSSTASVGIIRACHENTDGSANLVLQGLARVQVIRIAQEEPYRTIEIAPLKSDLGSTSEVLRIEREYIEILLDEHNDIAEPIPEQFLKFIDTIKDPDVFIDVAAYSLCPETEVKQKMLETLNTYNRFELFKRWLINQNKELRLQKKLQGQLDDDDIELN